MRESFYRSRIEGDNTAYLRSALADSLIENHVFPGFGDARPEAITLVDVACSTGLFAIEYSKKGYNSYGVDFDIHAIEIARELNEEEGANATFVQMDVSDWDLEQTIDIAICFDVFEHLHDDELGSLLVGLRRKLSERGCLVFHTAPLQYDYLFWSDQLGMIEFPLALGMLKFLPKSKFTRLVDIYARLKDIYSLSKGGLTRKDRIKKEVHCNPLTKKRLVDILERCGYQIMDIESGFLGNSQLPRKNRKFYHKQEVTHRSLWGVAKPRKM